MRRREPRKRSLTELLVRRAALEPRAYAIWDTRERGLCLCVQPTGHRAFKFVYSRGGRARWYHIGIIDLANARRIAAGLRVKVAEGKDPVAERKAERSCGTFGELAHAYRDRHAKKHNKSWRQAAALVDRHLMPRLGNLKASNIGRADVRLVIDKIDAPILANQVLAAASAIFTWATRQDIVEHNPCKGVDRNRTTSRERILSDGELPLFWKSFDDAGLMRSSALKLILLTGQRPGEVSHMRREHIKDGWWEMPGEPIAALGWPGTKNGKTHRVWLTEPARAILDDLADTGFVFAGARGNPVITGLGLAMQSICKKIGAERATPHDLRRTFSSKVTALGFGRDAMNRVTNHKEGGIADVYDRHRYAEENKRVMAAVAEEIMRQAEGKAGGGNIIALRA
jgi:integrase